MRVLGKKHQNSTIIALRVILWITYVNPRLRLKNIFKKFNIQIRHYSSSKNLKHNPELTLSSKNKYIFLKVTSQMKRTCFPLSYSLSCYAPVLQPHVSHSIFSHYLVQEFELENSQISLVCERKTGKALLWWINR